MGLGGLHRLLAHDPALGLAVLRSLKEWEHGRQCAELWGPSRPYKPTSWAHLGGVGWLGCVDGALWRGTCGLNFNPCDALYVKFTNFKPKINLKAESHFNISTHQDG